MNTNEFQPTMFIFAGNNGSGKSTIRNLIAEKIGIGINIDSDSITRKYIAKDSQSPELKAGKDAINLINECIGKRRSFSMETTLSGKLPFKLFKKAKQQGFELIMFYVGLDDVNTNIRRVAQRVKSGGHHIPTEDILRRKIRSINNLMKSIDLIDHIQIIDNSTIDAEIILVYRDNHYIYKSNSIPKWVLPIEESLDKKG